MGAGKRAKCHRAGTFLSRALRVMNALVLALASKLLTGLPSFASVAVGGWLRAVVDRQRGMVRSCVCGRGKGEEENVWETCT